MDSQNNSFWPVKIENLYQYLLNYLQSKTLSPLFFGPPCCFEDFYLHEYSISAIGVGDFVYSPLQADLLIISGIITDKKIPYILKTYEQMPNPKWAMTLGDCVYFKNDNIIKNLNDHISICGHVPGCPPKFEDIVREIENIKSLIRSGTKGKIN